MINLGSRNPQDSILIFLHIPKAGGTTLNGIINQQYARDTVVKFDGINACKQEINSLSLRQRESLRLIRGHFAFGLHQFLPRDSTYFTLLRDPVKRFISHYQYVRRSPGLKAHDLLQSMSLDEYVEKMGQEAGNLQTRMLFGLSDAPRATPEDIVTAAKNNLDQYFSVIGLVERFDKTLVLLQQAFDWRPPVYVKQNVTSINEKKQIVLADETLEKIKQCNALDLELYAYAVQKFDQQVTAIDDFEQRLNYQKSLNRLYQPVGRAYSFARSIALKF